MLGPPAQLLARDLVVDGAPHAADAPVSEVSRQFPEVPLLDVLVPDVARGEGLSIDQFCQGRMAGQEPGAAAAHGPAHAGRAVLHHSVYEPVPVGKIQWRGMGDAEAFRVRLDGLWKGQAGFPVSDLLVVVVGTRRVRADHRLGADPVLLHIGKVVPGFGLRPSPDISLLLRAQVVHHVVDPEDHVGVVGEAYWVNQDLEC